MIARCVLQAKVLFNVVNYGNAFATGAIGVGLFTLDWQPMLHNGLEDLIFVGLLFLSPCSILAKIVAPNKKTAADAAKDPANPLRRVFSRGQPCEEGGRYL